MLSMAVEMLGLKSLELVSNMLPKGIKINMGKGRSKQQCCSLYQLEKQAEILNFVYPRADRLTGEVK